MCLVQVMLELARLYLTLDEVDACQDQCSVILKSDQFNEDATLVCFVSPAAFSLFRACFWHHPASVLRWWLTSCSGNRTTNRPFSTFSSSWSANQVIYFFANIQDNTVAPCLVLQPQSKEVLGLGQESETLNCLQVWMVACLYVALRWAEVVPLLSLSNSWDRLQLTFVTH